MVCKTHTATHCNTVQHTLQHTTRPQHWGAPQCKGGVGTTTCRHSPSRRERGTARSRWGSITWSVLGSWHEMRGPAGTRRGGVSMAVGRWIQGARRGIRVRSKRPSGKEDDSSETHIDTHRDVCCSVCCSVSCSVWQCVAVCVAQTIVPSSAITVMFCVRIHSRISAFCLDEGGCSNIRCLWSYTQSLV